MIWFSRLTGTITTLSTAAFLTSDLLAASIQTSVVARVDPSEWSFFESTFLDENCEVGEWEEALRNFLSFAFVRTMCKTYDQLARDGWLDDVVNDEGIILDELFSKALWAYALEIHEGTLADSWNDLPHTQEEMQFEMVGSDNIGEDEQTTAVVALNVKKKDEEGLWTVMRLRFDKNKLKNFLDKILKHTEEESDPATDLNKVT